MALSSAASPASSRLALGSSSTTRRRIAVQRARERRCAGAGRRTAGCRLRRSACRSPWACAGSSRACPARWPLRSPVGVDLAEAGDVLGDRAVEQLDVLRQVAERRAERLAFPARIGWPSSSTGPFVSGQMPIRERASVDLPAPDGPTIATTCRPGTWRRGLEDRLLAVGGGRHQALQRDLARSVARGAGLRLGGCASSSCSSRR